MTVYVVGDIQGCYRCLQQLLEKAGFSPPRDQLWAVGDLVNRGPDSLETLRFCKSLGASFRTVLGNHDLHLLAVARGARAPNNKDTLGAILSAHDKIDLLDWLQHQPLLLSHSSYTLVHAGIPPQWSIEEARTRAKEVESTLSSHLESGRFFKHMYGNDPSGWREGLEGHQRLRVITNYFTRMRYCTASGDLELTYKLPPGPGAPAGFLPWFSHPERKTRDDKIIFGHWASLAGEPRGKNLYPLDTGCVWGGRLRLMSLANGHYFHQGCSIQAHP